MPEAPKMNFTPSTTRRCPVSGCGRLLPADEGVYHRHLDVHLLVGSMALLTKALEDVIDRLDADEEDAEDAT